MSVICFYSQFTASKVGVNSLTVTWDIERITRSDGTRSALVTGGANSITIGRRGLYGYLLTGADLTLYDYIGTAITADTSVDAKEVPGLWTLWSISWNEIASSLMTLVGSFGKQMVDNLDVAVSTRSSHTAADIWSVGSRTLTSFGTLVSDVWAYTTRTLTSAVAGVTVEEIWNYVSRTLTSVISTNTYPDSASLTQSGGKFDITMRLDNDLSFTVTTGFDLTLYDYNAYIVPMTPGSTEIPITITPIDLVSGKLQFFISKTSIKDVPISTDKNKWYFNVNSPKQEIPAITVFTRTVLQGYFNINGK